MRTAILGAGTQEFVPTWYFAACDDVDRVVGEDEPPSPRCHLR